MLDFILQIYLSVQLREFNELKCLNNNSQTRCTYVINETS